MSDTMMSMDNYRFVDELRPDQLMVGDIIEFSDEITEIGIVINIEEVYSNKQYSYTITGKNDFNETLEMVVDDNTFLKLFVEEE